jgi:hypothetical protein
MSIKKLASGGELTVSDVNALVQEWDEMRRSIRLFRGLIAGGTKHIQADEITVFGDQYIEGVLTFGNIEKYMVFAGPQLVRVVGGSPPDIGTEGTFGTLLFASNGTEEVFFNVHIPPDRAAGTDVKLAAYWAPTDGSTGGVAWEFDWEAVASESDEALGAGSAHIDIHDVTQELDNELLETAYGTIAGALIANDDTIGINFYRDHDDGDDTYAADAALIHIEVEYDADRLGG